MAEEDKKEIDSGDESPSIIQETSIAGDMKDQMESQRYAANGVTDTPSVKENSTPASQPVQPADEPPDFSNQLEMMASFMKTTSEALSALQNGFESKIKYDASKERVIDSLHEELQAHREGLHLKIMRPVFFDLMEMHDDVTNLLKHNQPVDGEAEMTTRLRRNLASFQETIESVLEKQGVIVYNEPGEKFAPQRQRALRAEPTDDPNKDQTICERIRKGFEYENKILRPETVVLYKHIVTNKS